MSADNHGDFFDEICRTLKAKARREVKDEMRVLKKRNVSLEKRLGDETVATHKLDLQAEVDARAFTVREATITAREKNINMAITEIKYLYEQVRKVQDMPVKKFVIGSTDNWGCMSERAKKLSKIGRAKA